MSGGSFDYICWKDPDELLTKRGTVQEMADWLRGRGKEDAAREVEKLALDLQMFYNMIESRKLRLEDIMHGAEWWCSGDYGEESFDKVWQGFLEGKKA